jgi:hypothetical protein
MEKAPKLQSQPPIKGEVEFGNGDKKIINFAEGKLLRSSAVQHIPPPDSPGREKNVSPTIKTLDRVQSALIEEVMKTLESTFNGRLPLEAAKAHIESLVRLSFTLPTTEQHP